MRKYPNIERVLDEGVAWVEPGGEIVGRPADGTIVSLGSDFEEEALERYLRSCPGPESW